MEEERPKTVLPGQLLRIVSNQTVEEGEPLQLRFPAGGEEQGPCLRFNHMAEDEVLSHQIRPHRRQVSVCLKQPGLVGKVLLRNYGTEFLGLLAQAVPEPGITVLKLLQRQLSADGGYRLDLPHRKAQALILAACQLADFAVSVVLLPVQHILKDLFPVPLGGVLSLHPCVRHKQRVQRPLQLRVHRLQRLQERLDLFRFPGFAPCFNIVLQDCLQFRLLQGLQGQKRLPVTERFCNPGALHGAL